MKAVRTKRDFVTLNYFIRKKRTSLEGHFSPTVSALRLGFPRFVAKI